MIEVAGSLHILLPMGLFLVLMLLGLPIAFAMGIGGIVGLLGTFGPDATLGILTNVPMRTATNYMLTTVAAFVLMAELAGQSGITERLFAMADKFVGHLRGGLAMATIVASAVFGAISGSSLAAAATMSRIAVPQMLDAGYSKSFSAGTVGIAGTLAVLIPPSLVLIIYGILTETSISDLLLAGILPGLLTVAGHLVAIALWIRLRPEAAPGQRPRAGWKERAETAKTGWPFMLVIGLVFTGLYSGVFTATEAGAMGAGATFVVWCLGQGRRRGGLAPLGQGNLFRAIDRSLRTTAMLVSLLIGAYIFSYFIVSTGLSQAVVSAVAGAELNRHVLLVAILAVFLVMGLFLSQLEIMVLTLPFVFPVIVQQGFDPVFFGILLVKTVEIGLVSPPVGMNVYVVAKSGAGVDAIDGFRGVSPFIVVEVVVIFLLICFPEIALLIPGR